MTELVNIYIHTFAQLLVLITEYCTYNIRVYIALVDVSKGNLLLVAEPIASIFDSLRYPYFELD